VSGTARAERAGAVVRDWVASTMGWGPERAAVYPAQPSTPGFDLVAIVQNGVRSGGELYVMTDGERVLPAGAANLGTVLAEEGVADDPEALPAALVAELFFRMGQPGGGRPILAAYDPALPEDARSAFAPPHAERDGDGVRIAFWSERAPGGPLERWTLRLEPGGELTQAAEPAG